MLLCRIAEAYRRRNRRPNQKARLGTNTKQEDCVKSFDMLPNIEYAVGWL
jgi:hypothetical protein